MQKRTATLADGALQQAEIIVRYILKGEPITDMERRYLFGAIYAARHALATGATTKRARGDAWYVAQDRAQNIARGHPEMSPLVVGHGIPY